MARNSSGRSANPQTLAGNKQPDGSRGVRPAQF